MPPQRFREQFRQIQRSMPDVPLAMGPDDAGEFLYEKGSSSPARARRRRSSRTPCAGTSAPSPPAAPDRVRRLGPAGGRSGVVRIQVSDPGEGDAAGDPAVAGALRSLAAVEGRAGRRMVSRNHVVHIAVNACPGDEPVPVARDARPNPAVAPIEGEPGEDAARVLVVDTGLMHDYRQYPPLARTHGDAQVAECDDDGVLQQYCGHGTFIAGLVAAVAPHTDITVSGALNDAGAVLEHEFGEKLFDAVEAGGWPDVLSLSMRHDERPHRRAPRRRRLHARTAPASAPCWSPPRATTPAPRPSGPPPTPTCPATRTPCSRSARCARTASPARASPTTAAG